MTAHDQVVSEMMERSKRMGRAKDGVYIITKSDVKRLNGVSFPITVEGEEISLDRENTLLRTVSTEDAQDFLMWVGYTHYPTIKDVSEEFLSRGASKRVGRIPHDLVPGKSRVFLAHDEGIRGDAVIFGYYVVDRIELIISDDSNGVKEVSENVTCVSIGDTWSEERRGGGWRSEVGAKYLVGEPESVVIFSSPRDYNALISASAVRFRSYKRISGQDIIASDARKSAPSEREERRVMLDPEIMPPSGKEWTDDERKQLHEAVLRHGKLYPAFKEFSRQTNRSMRSAEYQWTRMRKEDRL